MHIITFAFNDFVFADLIFFLLGMFVLYIFNLCWLLYVKNDSFIKAQNILKNFYIVILSLFTLSFIIYLFFPSFSVPFEETFIEEARNLSKNIPLYPPSNEYYPYNTMLYGPIIPLILLIFIKIPISIFISSKIPSFIIFVSFVCLTIYNLNSQQKNIKSKLFQYFPYIYLLFLLKFNTWVYCLKAEPYFLFLVALTIFIVHKYKSTGIVFIILGFLSGFSSMIKLHGAIYIVIAFCCTSDNFKINIKKILLYTISFFIGCILPFTNQSISLFSYIDLLTLVSTHGLNLMLFITALATLFVFLFPLFVVFLYLFVTGSEGWNRYKFHLLIIVCLELLLAIPSSKNGSFVNHLIPLIPANAFFIGKFIKFIPSSFFHDLKIKLCHSVIQSLYLVLSFICLANVVLIFIALFYYWSDSSQSIKEVKYLNNKYLHVMMGISDTSSLYLYYNRILLDIPQIDYLGFGDLKFAGYSDFELEDKINDCSINYFILPKSGVPFMYFDPYIGQTQTLLSVNTIKSFQKNFVLIDKTDHYNVFECQQMDSPMTPRKTTPKTP
ncbi:MAG: hypothetical protein LBS60_08475 [Deltaproteobacteria bacterium]|jgi:hypothetical protein|nr:hypothetical protein [Deltaproteobacteria bacterium]